MSGQCSECGSDYQPKQARQLTCSKACKMRRDARIRIESGRLAEQHRRSAAKRAAWQAANRAKYRGTRTCPCCGVEIESRADDAKRLEGRPCASCAAGQRKGQPRPTTRRAAARAKIRRAERGIHTRNLWAGGPCRRCGDTFVASANGAIPTHCSDRCRNADANDRRRARERNAYVAPVRRFEVFERDGWRCGICGVDVDRDAMAPHPLAPVLDHVIALADGGTHEPSNVQCAHFLCNSTKGGSEGRQPTAA